MAWSRNHGGRIPRLTRESELAQSDGARIAERVGQVSDRSSEAAFEEWLAFGDLARNGRRLTLCQYGVRQGVCADRHLTLPRQNLNLVPAQAAIRGHDVWR